MIQRLTVTGNKLSANTLQSTQHIYDTSLANEPTTLQYLLLELDNNKLKTCAYHLTKSKVVGFSLQEMQGDDADLKSTLAADQKLNHSFEQTLLTVRCNNYTIVPRTYLGNDKVEVFKLTNSFDEHTEVLLQHALVNLRADVLFTLPIKKLEAINSSFSRVALLPHIAPRIEHELNQNNAQTQDRILIHLTTDWLDVIVVQDGKLTLSNSFYIASKEDVAYYTLFCAEALKMDPEKTLLIYSGLFGKNNPALELLKSYWLQLSPAKLLHNAKISDEMPSYEHAQFDYITQTLLCAS
jgi:hypothetical protein